MMFLLLILIADAFCVYLLHLTFFGVFARFWTVLVDYDCVLAVS